MPKDVCGPFAVTLDCQAPDGSGIEVPFISGFVRRTRVDFLVLFSKMEVGPSASKGLHGGDAVRLVGSVSNGGTSRFTRKDLLTPFSKIVVGPSTHTDFHGGDTARLRGSASSGSDS